MTLEEADQWFESYKAFINFNKRSMIRLEISVRRVLLNKCLDSKMVSALRTHKDVLPTTEIDAPNGCLVRLREIFLEKNPLWLRRHGYFQCVQDESETVEEWWSRKLDKARECQLERITQDEIGMLELIRGIESQRLRQEFLKQKDPTLDGLLQIAKNWQRSTDVNKNMEATDARKAFNSSYKRDKAKDWQNKSGGNTDPNAGDKPSSRETLCGHCGQRAHANRDPCPAKGQECGNCGKKNHFDSVCRSAARAKSPQAGSRAGRVKVVMVKRVSAKVKDDSEPTPLMQNVRINPIDAKGKGKAPTMDAFPDTGCQQSLISEDLIGTCGLILDTHKKK